MDDNIPVHAAVDSWVELSKKITNKKLSGLINAVLRKAHFINKKMPIPNQDLASWQSFPDWMITNWVNQFGKSKTNKLIDYLNQSHGTDLRINLPIDKVERRLLDQGISWSKSPNSKNFIRINIFSKRFLNIKKEKYQ